jgi:hypothetical protein
LQFSLQVSLFNIGRHGHFGCSLTILSTTNDDDRVVLTVLASQVIGPPTISPSPSQSVHRGEKSQDVVILDTCQSLAIKMPDGSRFSDWSCA